MRILVTTRFYKNGQTTHVTDLCSELIRQGHEVLLILTQLHDPPYTSYLQKMEIPHVTTTELGRLQASIHRRLPRPHIIHNHSVHTLKLAERLGEQLEIPLITTVHYLDFDPQLLKKQDAVVLISGEMEQSFGKLDVASFVVENGVPVPKDVSPSCSWNKKAVFLAQVNPAKEGNFQAMTETLLTWGWNIHSAGNWRYPGVICHGWVNDVEPLIRSSDLVIGSGRAIRQGMASGKPCWVLGAYSDGLVTPENVADLEWTNFSGRFSKEPFSPRKAAKDLKKPLTGKMLTLGAFGRKHAEEHFSIEGMVEKLVTIYENCLGKCSREKET